MKYLLAIAISATLCALHSATWREWDDKGTALFQRGQYEQAAAAFQKAVDLAPTETQPHVNLARTFMSLYIPGAEGPDNLAHSANAEREFLRALELDPANKAALRSIAQLEFIEAQTNQGLAEKISRLREAKDLYGKLVALDPTDKEAHYSLGVVAWNIFFREWTATRVRAGMKPEDPGPIPNQSERVALQSKFETSINDGIDHLRRALEIDSQYDDAMAYLNLLLRESADLCDTDACYQHATAEADAWMQKALETRRARSDAAAGQVQPPAPPPPPPLSPPSDSAPRRITVGGIAQKAMLISQRAPVYPPAARSDGIQGSVRFRILIGPEGDVKEITLVTGDPALTAAAEEALRQWRYRPTLLNGQPVEVITLVDVNFTLDQ